MLIYLSKSIIKTITFFYTDSFPKHSSPPKITISLNRSNNKYLILCYLNAITNTSNVRHEVEFYQGNPTTASSTLIHTVILNGPHYAAYVENPTKSDNGKENKFLFGNEVSKINLMPRKASSTVMNCYQLGFSFQWASTRKMRTDDIN